MPNHTRGRWTQDSPNTDGQIFLGMGSFGVAGSTLTITKVADGNYYYQVPASSNSVLLSAIDCLLRTGQLATNADSQEQFGTAALQPGPSLVANTSDPLGIRGFPPFKNSANPIYGAIANIAGAVPKGIQVNWVDVIYNVGTLALTSINLGVHATTFANNAAPAVTNIIVYGANGLSTAVQVNPYRTRVNVAAPSFIVTDGSSLNVEVGIVTPATSTCNFYGLILGVSFNYN